MIVFPPVSTTACPAKIDTRAKTFRKKSNWKFAGWPGLRDGNDGTNFHAATAALAGRGDFRSPGNSFVQILAVQNIVTSELLLGFGKRAVTEERLVVANPDSRGGSGGLKWLGAAKYAMSGSFDHHVPMPRTNAVRLFLRHLGPVHLCGI